MSAPLTWNETENVRSPALTWSQFGALVLEPLASLKLTVALFAFAIFIVLAGTLAQVDRDIWDVIRIYFRAPIAWIEPHIFFPPTFFPASLRPTFPDWFVIPFPGGWMIGAVMALNLVAAHLVRFQVHARGLRLAVGLGVIAVGGVLTWLVVQYGASKDGVQQDASQLYDSLWLVIRGLLAASWLGLGWLLTKSWLAFSQKSRGLPHLLMLVLLTVVLLAAGGLIYQVTQVRFGDSAMRILWQLSKGSVAGLVLLGGCWLVFGKRAGIVLLHGGVGLMMFGELLVGVLAVEGQMPIAEGETVNFVHDIRTWELAVIDPADEKEDRVLAVPRAAFQQSFKSHVPIADAQLPFRLEVVKLAANSNIRDLKSDETPIGTKGVGRVATFDEIPQISGVSTSGKLDLPAMYVKLTSPDGKEELGTYLFGLELNPQDVTVGDKTYRVGLRFKRTYKPYAVTLKDVRKVDYVGTSTPRDYSSDVVLNDAARNVHDRDVKIWMNNPLRFAGETFYQSGYNKDLRTGEETTTLAVVTNTGWMIPYVSCMIVAIGMLAHFGMTLMRFLQKAGRSEHLGEPAVETEVAIHDPRRRAAKPAISLASSQPSLGPAGWLLPAAVVALAAIGTAMQARVPVSKAGQFDLYRFGEIPIVADGRAKPVDTLARHSLLAISGKASFKDAHEKRQPAVKWFLDLMAVPSLGGQHHVIRIENLEVQELLGLERREGFRYSLAEVFPTVPKLMKEADAASKIPGVDQSLYQQKILELREKLSVVDKVFQSFTEPRLDGDGEKIVQQFMTNLEIQKRLKKEHPALAIPPMNDQEEWETFASAWLENFRKKVLNQPPNEFEESWEKIYAAYARGNTAIDGESSVDRERRRAEAADEFNSEVEKLHTLYAKQTPAEVNLQRVDFESYFNRVEPMTLAIGLYVVAFVIAAIGWLCLAFNWPAGWRIAGRTAFSLIAFALIIHTLALLSRMYISGRPPVTNLYSSAVFIGWGCVVLGLVLEAVFRVGFGNVVATVAGYSTLLIAWRLESDGSDTFSVMQAVLDTQFWLATHVTCITLGYATTYLAGLFGLIYILVGLCTPYLTPQLSKDLNRMTYGTLCFSIFFSFVGTVLGGLWADDSWGRFWGWDPKENGALMIVLWNALALHARWGGMVKERGLAVLAVAGNIVVSWSWFGVNALSVGLHSYGFDRRIFTLFCILTFTQLPLIALGLIPRDKWWSRKSLAA